MYFPFPQIPFILYAGMNILAFAVYSHDKLMAKMRRERISENTLLFVAVFGPIGALTAMAGFRHKIRHVKFILVPVFFILHMLLVVWLWLQVGG